MEKTNAEGSFSYEEGLKTIYSMIEATRGNIGGNYLYYLLWGYLVSIACILEFLFIRVYPFKHHYLVWPIMMGAGVIASTVMSLWQRRKQNHKTIIGHMMTYLWGGWLVTLLLLQLFANMLNEYNLILPLTMAMYGLGVFVSGGIIKFRPLILGGILSWIAAMVSFFQPHDIQLLITTGTLVVGYIVPGYILGGLAKQQKV